MTMRWNKTRDGLGGLLKCVVGLLLLAAGLPAAHAYYDPAPQRWINRDPIQEDGGVNLYTHVFNNPASRSDPFGESTLDDLDDPNSKKNLDNATRCKPKNCPPGTVPIDQYRPKLTKEQIHKIKKSLGLGPKDWVGIDANGNVRINDGEGHCEDMGDWKDYGPFTK